MRRTTVRPELEAYDLASVAPAAPARRRVRVVAPPAAWWFSVAGALGLLLFGMAFLLRALGVPGYAALRPPAGGTTMALLTCVGFVLTGRLLAAGERRGAAAAALTVGVPLLLRAAQGAPLGTADATVGVVGLLLLLTARRDLR
ncbi:hypothetical protein [Roseisolibacter sp. H3M3-2]|uniref:hypothetical protein n=1 Tax=Roseisolibacter sp. H3M3-2 TaxID=3031323 RepID=UPI0023D9BBBE|nr:hypothetical protein [Roseisolibacter sp. H3M3-2]MDF1505859.1 hypothetical protein [Roseisolibacter sp. H3M3-2]